MHGARRHLSHRCGIVRGGDARRRAAGRLPLTPELLREAPSGDLFPMSQNAGMGWAPGELGHDDIMIVSTLGGLRGADGTPTALGLHTGHYELGLLVEAAARELGAQGALPYAASGRPLSASLTGPSPSSAPIGFAISSAARPRDSLCSSRSMKAVVDVRAARDAGTVPPVSDPRHATPRGTRRPHPC
ncbi:protein of unknown function [Micropruina glycogenica]|uniref:Uncharacterized protein n=2 Tax=Micropruina glycogenica TaxID=75385 RepID=A0A2N9JH59_9ACTN|nr:protein of unknown function [Micropruina glycogenica]